MKYTEMVTGLFDFIKGSVNLDESPKIVPAEPPKPKEEPKPVPAPTKESKGDDSLKECPVCKTMTVQRNEDPQAPTIWSCKNCGHQIENGEVVADGVKDRKVEPAKEGKVRERKHLIKEDHTLQRGSEWYEVFIDKGEEGGTESVASSNTYKGALKIKADLEKEKPGQKYGIDKWRMTDSGNTEPIDTWTPEQEKASEGKDPNVLGKGVDKMSAEELIKSLYEEMRADKAFMGSMAKVNEVAPAGWEPVVKKMKKHKEIETPWALAWWMKGKGYKPTKEGKDPNVDGKGVDKMSAEELIQTLYEDATDEGKIPDVDKADPAKLIQDLYEQHPEQFNVVARSLTDQNIAKDLATKHKGQVVPDSVDAKKFMVITKIGTTEQMGAGPYNENVNMKEAVQKRTRGKVVFPADSPKVTDKGDHFPINDVGQARNALSRAGQYSSAPAWYSGDLTSLKNAIKRAVKQAYPSIEVTEKIEYEDDLEEKFDLLDEAKDSLQEAVNAIEQAVEGTDQKDHTQAYLIDQIKVHIDSEQGLLSGDYNIETLKEDLQAEFDEGRDKGSTHEAKKVNEEEVDAIDYSDEYRTLKIIIEDNIGRTMSDEQFNQVIASMKEQATAKDLFEEQIKSLNDEILHFLMGADDHIHKVLGEAIAEKMKVKKGHKKAHKKVKIKDGKIPDPNAPDADKIKDLTEHDKEAMELWNAGFFVAAETNEEMVKMAIEKGAGGKLSKEEANDIALKLWNEGYFKDAKSPEETVSMAIKKGRELAKGA